MTQEVYAQLHRLAQVHLHRERASHTLQATALVHEAYLRLAGQDRARWSSRGQFLRTASEMMRRILVNHERDRTRLKRGGKQTLRSLGDDDAVEQHDPVDLVALDEALERLKAIDERKVVLVNLRFFAGLSLGEAASALGISLAQAKREWALTKAWLMREIGPAELGS
ncbi:MAG: RNA polymerase subunit sigma [Planctomycetes bacterium]|nr:RNA polymerase subunit sigma [Planctomycetota bacterium]